MTTTKIRKLRANRVRELLKIINAETGSNAPAIVNDWLDANRVTLTEAEQAKLWRCNLAYEMVEDLMDWDSTIGAFRPRR